MFILHIEHPVPSYEGWKKAFDSDPLDRKKSGVRSYRILRPVDDPDYVLIELEFEELEAAQSMHQALKQLWNKVEGTVMTNPRSRITRAAESVRY